MNLINLFAEKSTIGGTVSILIAIVIKINYF